MSIPSPLDGASAATSSKRNDLVKNYRVHPTQVKLLIKWAPLMQTYIGRGLFYIFWGILVAAVGGVAWVIFGSAVGV